MPAVWPSCQLNCRAYRPTAWALTGLGGGVYMGRTAAGLDFGCPGFRPWLARSSLQVAQGQASRSQANVQALRWPSCQSISSPLPSVSRTRTFSGVMAIRGSGRLSSDSRAACSLSTKRMPSWLITSVYRDQGSGILPKEPPCHRQPDENHQPAQDRLRHLAGKARRTVAADGAGDHGQQAIAPLHLAADDENEERHAVGHGGGNDLEGVDLVQVLKTEEGQKRNEQKAGPGAKVANVEADKNRRQKHVKEPRRSGFAAGRALLHPRQPAGNR